MIDPGHGGTNLGAPTLADGVYEKTLTLDLARRVRAEILRAEPRAAVVLTREDDRYVTLRGRAAVANRLRADALVSLHLNASGGGARRGFETYVYGAGPLLECAESSGGAAGAILAELRSRGLAQLSADLGAEVQRRLGAVRGRALDRGVRAAPLDVLREAEAPAVLVEAAYLDHPDEGREILGEAERQRVAGAVARAVVEFRRRVARRVGAARRLASLTDR